MLGSASGINLTAGSSNTFIGTSAGLVCTSGSDNTFLGRFAGVSTITGTKNTYLGHGAAGTAALSRSAAIGHNAQVTNSNSMVLGGTGVDAVHVGIGVTAPAAELEVNGFTMLGSNAPAIKMLKLTGTSAATQGGASNIAHGLPIAKILAVEVLLEYVANAWIPDSYINAPGYTFSVIANATNIVLINQVANSGNILSKPVKVLITYEE